MQVDVATTLVPLGRVALDRIVVHPDIAAVVPPLPERKYLALRDGMDRDGQLLPVEVALIDGGLILLEGHHRYQVAGELGWPDIEAAIRHGIDTVEQAMAFTAEVNWNRRQLTLAQDKALMAKAAQLREAGLSIRAVALKLGLPKSTMNDILAHLSGAGQLNQPTQVTGLDGKRRKGRAQPDLLRQLSQADPTTLATAVKADRLEQAVEEAEAAQTVLTTYLDELLARLERREGTVYPPDTSTARRRLPPRDPVSETVTHAVGRTVPIETDESEAGRPSTASAAAV